MRGSVIAFSDAGVEIGQKIVAYLQRQMRVDLTRCPSAGLKQWTAERFGVGELLVFVGSCGIAVRAIAPHLQHKTTDPAVLVVDDQGKQVISLLSGHLGGANEWTIKLSEHLKANPVITTATDLRQCFAVDLWAKSQHLKIENPQQIKRVSSKLLSGEQVTIRTAFPISGNLPKGVHWGDEGKDADIVVDYRHIKIEGKDSLFLIAPVVRLCLTADKAFSMSQLEDGYQHLLEAGHCHPLAVRKMGYQGCLEGRTLVERFCHHHSIELILEDDEQTNHHGKPIAEMAFEGFKMKFLLMDSQLKFE